MSDIKHELEQLSQQVEEQAEVALPSLEEQKAIAAELKQLESEGKLTPEILEHYFGKFFADSDTPIH
jgi:restriction endonuclease S subunit